MKLSWHIICSEKSISQIRDVFQGKTLEAAPYWKDSDCLELYCSCDFDLEESQLTALCRKISGIGRVQIDRQRTGTEYACYATLEEIRNGDKAFVVCFVNIKENEL